MDTLKWNVFNKNWFFLQGVRVINYKEQFRLRNDGLNLLVR